MSPVSCKNSSSSPPPPPAPPMPGDARPCCLLMPFPGPLRKFGIGIVDPAAAGAHHFGGGDTYGIAYTCAAGFFDFGHARDTIDLTRFHHHQLTLGRNNAAGKSYAGRYEGGTVKIRSAIPAAEVLETAASIAYDESVWHEIVTWYAMSGGGHNSSFSPEDLVSNFLGTWVGRQAIHAGGAFDSAATKELSTLLTALGARPPADTTVAFEKIAGRWVAEKEGYFGAGADNRYLLRRNFHVSPIEPWFAPGIGFCASTTWPSSVPKEFGAAIGGRYDIEFPVPGYASALGSKLSRGGFAGAIATIKTEAAGSGPRGYGANFETP